MPPTDDPFRPHAPARPAPDPYAAPYSTWRDPTDPSVLSMILRHPLLICGAVMACVAGAWAYVRSTPPLYTSAASLRVQQGPPQVIGSPEPPHGADETASFLNAEAAVLASAPVLEAALADPAVRRTGLFAAAPDPVELLKKKLRVAVGRKDGILGVEFDAPAPADAAAVVNAVVEAYTIRESRQSEEIGRKLLSLLTRERDECARAVRDTTDGMLAILKEAGTSNLDGRDKALELTTLRGSLHAAQSDAGAAEAQYKEAFAALEGNAALTTQLEKMTAARSVPTNSELENSQIRLEVAELELRKQDMLSERRWLASNPHVVGVQGQLDRLRVLYAASAYGRWAQAKERAEQLQTAYAAQEAAARELPEKAARYARAELELKRLDRHLDVLGERVTEIKAREGSGSLHINVVEPGRPAARPAKPEVPRVLALAATLGAMGGAAAACAREAARSRKARAARQSAPPVPATPENVLQLAGQALGQDRPASWRGGRGRRAAEG